MNAPTDQSVAEAMEAIMKRNAGDPAVARVLEELSKVALVPGAVKTDLSETAKTGFFGRLGLAAEYVINGITPKTWFAPGQPMRPQADAPDQGTRGRRFDYPVGTNLQYQPKTEPGSGIPFFVLRGLAENYDLLRLAIETRKDQFCAIEWDVQCKDEDADPAKFKDQIKRAKEFFERPTPEHDWNEWLRALLDDCLVCDSMTLYPRLNRGGTLHSLVPVDPALMKRLVDESGMMPLPPSPAFQQILKGVPAVDYYAMPEGFDPAFEGRQLLYWIRNPRSYRLYGLSPTEQVVMTVNIALRRQGSQLEYYTEGSIPDMIIGLPESWTPDQLKELQDWWDSILSGNTATRRKVRFVPEMKGEIHPKDASVILKDETDEWLARIICFAFSLPPTALVKMVNRAAGEQIASTAREEGLMPMLTWFASKFTWVANNLLACPDVCFKFRTEIEVDPKITADVNTAYVRAGVISVDEARDDIGREPRGVDELTFYTATGVVPLKEGLEKAKEDIKNPPPPPPAFGAQPAPGGGKPPNGSAPPNGEEKREPGAKDAKEPPVEKGMPNIYLGDTIIRVTPGEPPMVKVDGVTVNVDQREGTFGPSKVTKKIVAKRDPLSGDLFGEITESAVGDPTGASLVKTVRVEREGAGRE